MYLGLLARVRMMLYIGKSISDHDIHNKKNIRFDYLLIEVYTHQYDGTVKLQIKK